MARALIIGGGAIGRGFLPWAFEGLEFDIFDSSTSLTKALSTQGGFHSFMSRDGRLEQRFFQPGKSTSNPAELDLHSYDLAFISVGPRNCSKIPTIFSTLTCPIFSVENDPSTVQVISNRLKRGEVFFGVPDVIASSTASGDNLQRDALSLHTENGTLYLEDTESLSPKIRNCLPAVIWADKEKMAQEWAAKLYLHNTPHCVAAYLGHALGMTYLHEAFTSEFVNEVVEGLIEELLLALKRTTNHDHTFLEEYAAKELRRFSNNLLFDPIFRVAREPIRKLQPSGRLTGALTLCLLAGVTPTYLTVGIVSALNYAVEGDTDFEYMSHLKSFGPKNFLKYFVGIEPDAIESKIVVSAYDRANKFLMEGLKLVD
jgi:mannitol-1-phosphate 5-dehydrogenase